MMELLFFIVRSQIFRVCVCMFLVSSLAFGCESLQSDMNQVTRYRFEHKTIFFRFEGQARRIKPDARSENYRFMTHTPTLFPVLCFPFFTLYAAHNRRAKENCFSEGPCDDFQIRFRPIVAMHSDFFRCGAQI